MILLCNWEKHPIQGLKVITWGFPKIRGALLGVPIKGLSILGSILGSPYCGKLPHAFMLTAQGSRSSIYGLGR